MVANFSLKKIFSLFKKKYTVSKQMVDYREIMNYFFIKNEEKRDKISRDIHNYITQLASIKICLETILDDKRGEGGEGYLERRHLVEVSVKEVESILDSMNNMIPILEPAMNIDVISLVRSVDFLCSIMHKQYPKTKIICRFNETIKFNFDEIQKVCVYRIIETAIRKSVEFCHASVIFVDLEGPLKLTIEDNGKSEEEDQCRLLNLWINELSCMKEGLVYKERTKEKTNRTTIIWERKE